MEDKLIICPLVEESNNIKAESVIELKKYLKTNISPMRR